MKVNQILTRLGLFGQVTVIIFLVLSDLHAQEAIFTTGSLNEALEFTGIDNDADCMHVRTKNYIHLINFKDEQTVIVHPRTEADSELFVFTMSDQIIYLIMAVEDKWQVSKLPYYDKNNEYSIKFQAMMDEFRQTVDRKHTSGHI